MKEPPTFRPGASACSIPHGMIPTYLANLLSTVASSRQVGRPLGL